MTLREDILASLRVSILEWVLSFIARQAREGPKSHDPQTGQTRNTHRRGEKVTATLAMAEEEEPLILSIPQPKNFWKYKTTGSV